MLSVASAVRGVRDTSIRSGVTIQIEFSVVIHSAWVICIPFCKAPEIFRRCRYKRTFSLQRKVCVMGGLESNLAR